MGLDFPFRSEVLIFHLGLGDMMSRKTKVNLVFYNNKSNVHLETYYDFSGMVPRVGDVVSVSQRYTNKEIYGTVFKTDHDIKYNDYGNDRDSVTVIQHVGVYLDVAGDKSV